MFRHAPLLYLSIVYHIRVTRMMFCFLDGIKLRQKGINKHESTRAKGREVKALMASYELATHCASWHTL